MPRRAPTICARPGCPRLARGRYCPEHTRSRARDDAARRGTAATRGYDRAWRKLRERILARDPVCRSCDKRPSSEVDHIVPKAEGGSDHPDNLQGLCKSCHSRKTVQEDGGLGR